LEFCFQNEYINRFLVELSGIVAESANIDPCILEENCARFAKLAHHIFIFGFFI